MPISDKMHYDREQGKWVWNDRDPAQTPIPQNMSVSPGSRAEELPGLSATPTAAPPAAQPDVAAHYQSSGEAPSNDPLTDPNAQDRFITPENTMIDQRIGFDVRDTDSEKIDAAFQQAMRAAKGGGAQVGESENLEAMFAQLRSDLEGGMNREDLIRRQFESQQPFFDAQYEDEVKGQAERTAAMGRTGSGMYDREFADITERSRLQREGLLGGLTANAAAQAIQDRLGLYSAGTGMAGVEANRDIAGAEISNAFRGQGLQALLGAAGLDLNRQGADIGTDLARRNALFGEREYEYRMSRDAMADQAEQMRYMNQGFEDNPLDQVNKTVSTEQDAASEYGANAGDINRGLGDAAEGRAQQPGSVGDKVSATYGTPTQFNRPRLKRPGSTINTERVPTTPTDFGAVRSGNI